MPIAKITGQGLAAIALSVALLWGCWLKEQALVQQDRAERARVLRDLQQLQHHTVPASEPSLDAPRAPRITAG